MTVIVMASGHEGGSVLDHCRSFKSISAMGTLAMVSTLDSPFEVTTVV